MRDDGDPTLRVFFAIALEGDVRRRAEAELRRLAGLADARTLRWVRPEGLHVTLRFLGATPAAQLPDLLARVASHTGEVPRFSLRLGGVAALPSWRRARVVTLEAAPEASLRRLAEAVEAGVVEAGFAPETRAFRPHVTLGRVRRGARLPRDAARTMTGPVTPGTESSPVTHAQLFRSDTTRSGSVYTSIGRVPLL